MIGCGERVDGLPPFIYTLPANPSQVNCVSTISASHVDAQQCMSAPYQWYNQTPPPPSTSSTYMFSCFLLHVYSSVFCIFNQTEFRIRRLF